MSTQPDSSSQRTRKPIFLGFFLVFSWYSLHIHTGLTADAWQGAYLAPSGFFQTPTVADAVYRPTAMLGPEQALRVMALISAMAAAAACAVFAALLLRGRVLESGGYWPKAMAIAGALLLGLSPILSYEISTPSPVPITLLAALMSLWCLLESFHAEPRGRWLAGAGLSAGLAAANDPSMGLMLAILLVGQGFRPLEPRQWVAGIACIGLPFSAMALLPYLRSRLRGETLSDFLEYGLRTPYPVPGESWPRWGVELWDSAAWGAAFLPAVLLGVYGFRFAEKRRVLLVATVVILVFGPFLPALTNQYGQTVGASSVSASLLALCGLIIFGICGLDSLYRLGGSQPIWRAVTVSMFAAWMTALIFQAPDRRHGDARYVAEGILERCPEHAILVAGTPTVAGLLIAAQRVEQMRTDVSVVPVHALHMTAQRRHLSAYYGETISIEMPFPSYDTYARWANERPAAYSGWTEDREARKGERTGLSALAQWELVRANHQTRPIVFVASDAEWLPPRGRIDGWSLIYPRDYGSEITADADTAAFSIAAGLPVQRDPNFARMLTDILVPLSDAARTQGETTRALSLAALAATLSPRALEPALATMRALARSGEAELTAQAAQQLRHKRFETPVPSAWPEIVRGDLELTRVQESLGAVLTSEIADEEGLRARRAYVDRLWEADELEVLADAYEAMLQRDGEDREALFNYAAVLAQQGRLSEAREAVRGWVRVSGLSDTAAYSMLVNDGRFALLHGAGRPEGAIGNSGRNRTAAANFAYR